MKPHINNRRGMALAVTLCLIIVGAIGAAAFMYLVRTEIVQVRKQSNSLKAFYAAETGLEKALLLLKKDLYYTPGDDKPSWADDKLYYSESGFVDLTTLGYPKSLDPANPDYETQFYTITIPAETDYESEGNGKTTYQIQLSNLEGWSDRVWVKSTGRYYRKDGAGSYVPDAKRTILSLVGAHDASPWGYAIFANTGQNGMVINGNVDIRGSVQVLGEGLGQNDLAAEFSGTGGIGNNYVNIPDDLGLRIPSIEKTYYKEDGTLETLDSLEAVVAIQQGKLSLSGTATVGDPHVEGNALKETVTGIYIGDGYDGYTGNQGSRNVYSDNGTKNTYLDGVFNADFPWLTQRPYGIYNNYLEEFIRPNALVIQGDLTIDAVKGILLNGQPWVQPAPSWNKEYETWNEITFTQPSSIEGGLLTIRGMILVDGDISLFDSGNLRAIVYTGEGTLTAGKRLDGTGGNVTIDCNLVTFGYQTYPYTDFLGVMAQDTITFVESQTNSLGVFYAEEQIVSTKQTNVAGSFVSNYFDMGNQVPAIYQVPETTWNLPPGMIGSERAYALRKLTWREI